MGGTLGQTSDNDDVQIKGSTDQTLIGNVGDSLKALITSSALPSGAATSALQSTGNASLASIDAGIPAALGAAVIASSMPVNIASDQVVPVSATALPLPTGASTAALQGTGNTSLASLDTKTPTIGQKTASNSSPVVLASDQTAIPATQSGIWSMRQEPNHQIALGNGFTLPLASVNVNNTETNGIYLKNGSSKTLYIFTLLLAPAVDNANNWIAFRAYYNPTVTANGTSQTISNLLAGSVTATTATAFTVSTTSSRGTLVKYWPAGLNNAAAITQDTNFPNYFVLPANQTLLISAISKANTQAYSASIMWFEV